MLDITPGFAEERPGAVRALREVHNIPAKFELIVGDGYIRFWGWNHRGTGAAVHSP